MPQTIGDQSVVKARLVEKGSRLGDFLEANGPAFTWAQRYDIIDAWVSLLDDLYAHLPLKRAMYGYDPIRALAHLRTQVDRLSDEQFHRELIAHISRLRDRHTQVTYKPWAGKVAMLPFLVEECVDAGKRRYIVTKVDDGGQEVASTKLPFKKGVELHLWNGIPFARAVELHADRERGGHPDARRARGLESLTFRPLHYSAPPDERWVRLAYTTADHEYGETTLHWRVVDTAPSPAAAGTHQPQALRASTSLNRAINPAAEDVRRAKKLLFSGSDANEYADFLTARRVPVDDREVGYLRVWSFDVADPDAFLEAAITLLETLPKDGLIIDIRDNPGGLISAAEGLLQLFTDKPIMPTRFAFRATPLTAALASSELSGTNLGQWAASLRSAPMTGEAYSSHLQVSRPGPTRFKNRYRGPKVVVANANTYSAGDLFAAGVVDNGIAPLVCVGEATGGGGAAVWTWTQAYNLAAFSGHKLRPLPANTGGTIAALRAVRSGMSDGILIEDNGIPGRQYEMTVKDILASAEESNRDLIRHCVQLLERRG